MKPFAYDRAATVEEALSLAGDGAVFLAGGTNLVDHLRLGIREADRVVDITRLPLAEVSEREDGGLVIGSGVRTSDLAAHLAALDAEVVVTGPAGVRRIPFGDLHRLPGDRPDLDTTLEPGELVLAVELPPLKLAVRSRYRKVRERASYAFALVSVAAALDTADGVVQDVRLALGGVSHRPHRALVAEEALRGQSATPERFRAAIEAELEVARPGPDNAFKVPLVRNTVVAVLTGLAEGSAA